MGARLHRKLKRRQRVFGRFAAGAAMGDDWREDRGNMAFADMLISRNSTDKEMQRRVAVGTGKQG